MEVTKTINSIFMVPTLKIPDSRKSLMGNGFINAFERDVNKDVQYNDCVYLLFKPVDVDKFREFLDGEYERTKTVIDDYDYPEGYVVVVYELNPKFKEDFKLIRQGKYSKTSVSFQKLFNKTVTITVNTVNKEEVSLQYRIFNKTEDLVKFWEDQFGVTFGKEQEIWHGYNEERETLNINKINHVK